MGGTTDFERFWRDTLATARAAAAMAGPASFVPTDTVLRTIVVDDVTFPGFGGDPIRGWFLRPATATAPMPVVIEFPGYGGGRSLPSARLFWPSAGFAYLVVDTRGQDGDTPDPGAAGSSGHQPGFVTQGIDAPETYYYRRVFADAVLAVDAISGHPIVDAEQIVVAGRSQGGAIALAVAGLEPTVRAALIDVPFLCDVRRAVESVGDDVVTGYGEIRAHLAWRRDRVDEVFRTLDLFDGCAFAARATAPARFSTGMRDHLCPPATVVAAFERYAGPKRLVRWPFNGHEGGAEHDDAEQATFLGELGIAP